MFEAVLKEYKLDYVYIRDNWTMGALKLHMDRLRERYESQSAAMERARRNSSAKAQGKRIVTLSELHARAGVGQ